ncbi:MAG: hypothetical protein JSV35_06240 [Candidatus Bathyarchaeota archaeon]|nr:MAG: hypothetical protein JSV35_06240 [Candidatus Bathyarchaeota archaeon]
MRKFSDKRGQFSIIAAVLVATVLIGALFTTYSIVRNSPIQGHPQVLGSTEEMNIAASRVLEFIVGYYGSILEVTGNFTYAQNLAHNYLLSGLENIAYTHPDWNPTFELNYSRIRATWFHQTSFSHGLMNLTYSLQGLGVYGVQYSTSAKFQITVNPSNTSHVLVNVTRDTGLPENTLRDNNFYFYRYNHNTSTWELVRAEAINSITSSDTSTSYNLTVPEGVDPSSYLLKAVDHRGIMVTASTFSSYTYRFTWDQNLYSTLNQDIVVVELLQNGTVRWLGQQLELDEARPIPPIPVKAFHLNQTMNGINREVQFQIEDWNSNYEVPAGLTANGTILRNRQMVVFNVNHHVTEATLWWDGRDIANQTWHAYKNTHFVGDDPESGTLTNGVITLSIGNFDVVSTLGSVTSTATFMRINNDPPSYCSNLAYIIHHGVVRDIIHQEAEWSGGIPNCPNMYSQIVITLPANATYYTYALRTIFVPTDRTRTVEDLNLIRLQSAWRSGLKSYTENGTSGDYPVVAETLDYEQNLFYNFSQGTTWMHHWSEFIASGEGAGLLFATTANQQLYAFDTIGGQKTGAVNADHSSANRVTIELKPVARFDVSFQSFFDLTLHGAIVSFDGTDPIYPASGQIGLWVIAEVPPSLTVEAS